MASVQSEVAIYDILQLLREDTPVDSFERTWHNIRPARGDERQELNKWLASDVPTSTLGISVRGKDIAFLSWRLIQHDFTLEWRCLTGRTDRPDRASRQEDNKTIRIGVAKACRIHPAESLRIMRAAYGYLREIQRNEIPPGALYWVHNRSVW